MLKFKTIFEYTFLSLTFIIELWGFKPPYYRAAGWNLTPELTV
jgi:hypothetical protein